MDDKNTFQVKKSRFPVSLFAVYTGVLLLMSGIHTGLIVLANEMGWSEIVQTLIPIVYWIVVSIGLTIFTKNKIRHTYEEPMHELAEATAKVAKGDFSVYVPAQHTDDKLDYIDVMIKDFNKMVEELGSIETLKTDFFSNVSHEIKTPLSVISNYAQLLQKEGLTEAERREYTDNVLQATGRLSRLITNMLKLNKLERQAIKPSPQHYDLCEQLCEAVFQFEDAWEKKNIEFDADIEDSVMINADADLLLLVWNNILSNATKFTPEGGMITVRENSDSGGVTVTIADTGCGMDKATCAHIFDKFYQGDTSHATEGNGLGLALVLRILQLSDASISVTSEPGKGTAFTVWLPYGENANDDNEEQGQQEVMENERA